jgi:hypothetical protein
MVDFVERHLPAEVGHWLVGPFGMETETLWSVVGPFGGRHKSFVTCVLIGS